MNLPNIITITRFFFIPLYLFIFFSSWTYSNLFAFIVLLFAGLSDILDGYLARKNGQVTDIGKLLDPLADKLMMIAVIFSFVMDARISWLAAGFFLFRDVGMIVTSAFYHFKKYKILPANVFGKATTVIFYLAFLLLMFQWPYGQEVLWLAIIFSFITSLVYAISFLSKKPKMEESLKEPLQH